MFELLDGPRDMHSNTPYEYTWSVTSFDPAKCSPGHAMWSLRDHPDLALTVAELPVTGPDAVVPTEQLLTFLGNYGQLTPSFTVLRSDGETLDGIKAAMAGGSFADVDPRSTEWIFQLSRPVALIRAVAERLSSNDRSAVSYCLDALDLTPPGSLLRGLILQLLRRAIAGDRVRRCVGCGLLFTETEGASQATHRAGWKRGDAKYHSARCRKAFLERQRRKRLAESRTG